MTMRFNTWPAYRGFFIVKKEKSKMKERDKYYVETAICDAILCALIGGGLAWVLQRWWFA